MLSPGDRLPLTVEKPAAGGRMIARHDGRVVLVAGAIPGERITARIERVAKNVAYAETVSVEERSGDRRGERGDRQCGGCVYAHIAYAAQCAIKAAVIADAFARLGRINLPHAVSVAPSPEEGYRMRARLHVRGSRLGFFRENTHEICDPRQTRQLLPATCDALERLGDGLRSLGIERGEIELAENVDASDRVVFIENEPPLDGRRFERMAEDEALSGLVTASGWYGATDVTDRLEIGGRTVTLTRHVSAFFQGNRYLLSDLAGYVADQVEPGAGAIDLYAGTGLFALAVAGQAPSVTAVEGDKIAAHDLDRNTQGTSNVRTVHQSVESFVASTPAAVDPGGTLIVDPPRTGISREAIEGVIGLKASRIVYVSCDVATLARDARRLVDAGYILSTVGAFDLFPNTPHVETVVTFDHA